MNSVTLFPILLGISTFTFSSVYSHQCDADGQYRFTAFFLGFFFALCDHYQELNVVDCRGVYVLLQFCWRVHIINFCTKGARSLHIDLSL